MSNDAAQQHTPDAVSSTSPLRTTLDKLLALQAIDTQRDKLARARKQLDPGVEQQKQALAASDNAKTVAATLAENSGALKDAELEQQGIEGKAKRSEDQMRSGKMTNPREIANIERDLNQLQRQRLALDDKILHLMDAVESGKTKLVQAEAASSQAARALSTQQATYRANLEKNDQESRQLDAERPGAAAAIGDAALLQRYEALRVRPATGGLAVARIVDRHCTGCSGQVSIQEEQRVRDAKVVATCDNCGRILA